MSDGKAKQFGTLTVLVMARDMSDSGALVLLGFDGLPPTGFAYSGWFGSNLLEDTWLDLGDSECAPVTGAMELPDGPHVMTWLWDAFSGSDSDDGEGPYDDDEPYAEFRGEPAWRAASSADFARFGLPIVEAPDAR